MPIRKASRDYNSDYMSRYCDDQLERLEERLTALYSNASNELTAEYKTWFSKFEKQYSEKLEMVEAGDLTQKEFKEWVNRRMVDDKIYKQTISSMTDTLVNTDVAAMAIVNGKLPLVVAESYNFVQSLGFAAADEAGLSVGTFQVYNARTVQALIKDNPDILKYVNKQKDYTWNKDRLNNAITRSILNGDSIQKTAQRIQGVTNMDENAAIRTARTGMTAAENLGRNEGYHDIKENGVPCRMQWSATHDNRTRDTHILLDGTYQDEDGFFGVGIIDTPIEYPGDPAGDPEEIYNCRCRASLRLEGVDHSQDEDLYEKFMEENYPDDWEAVKQSREEKEAAFQEKASGAAERVEKERESKADNAEEQKAKEPEYSFTPAQTIEEAQTRAREAGAIYTKFDGWNLERANNALDALERLPSDCRPKVIADGKSVELVTDRKTGRKAESWYGVTYDYRPFTLRTAYIGFEKNDYDGGMIVGLNTKSYKTIDALTEAKEKAQEKYKEKTGREWFFNTRGDATAHHEMGHCLYNGRLAPNDRLREEWSGLGERWAKDAGCDMLGKSEEAFAEAWAGMQVGDERIPDYISDFIRRNT